MQHEQEQSLVYARVIVFQPVKCRTCGTEVMSGSEARLELALSTEKTGLPFRDRGLVCLRCFGQMPIGQQIPEVMLRK